jgi:hypothetical protein
MSNTDPAVQYAQGENGIECNGLDCETSSVKMVPNKEPSGNHLYSLLRTLWNKKSYRTLSSVIYCYDVILALSK